MAKSTRCERAHYLNKHCVVICRNEWTPLKDTYVALQFHPTHTNLNGPQSTMWHFHARAATILDVALRQRETSHITDGALVGLAESHPNSTPNWADGRTYLEHYFIDPTACRTDKGDSNAHFVKQVCKFAATIGSKILTGLDFDYFEFENSMT